MEAEALVLTTARDVRVVVLEPLARPNGEAAHSAFVERCRYRLEYDGIPQVSLDMSQLGALTR